MSKGSSKNFQTSCFIFIVSSLHLSNAVRVTQWKRINSGFSRSRLQGIFSSTQSNKNVFNNSRTTFSSLKDNYIFHVKNDSKIIPEN